MNTANLSCLYIDLQSPPLDAWQSGHWEAFLLSLRAHRKYTALSLDAYSDAFLWKHGVQMIAESEHNLVVIRVGSEVDRIKSAVSHLLKVKKSFFLGIIALESLDLPILGALKMAHVVHAHGFEEILDAFLADQTNHTLSKKYQP